MNTSGIRAYLQDGGGDERPEPAGAAVGDLIESEELGLVAGEREVRIERAPEGLRLLGLGLGLG